MILPMKKVCLMVQESSRDEALLKLREAGVMHLHTANTISESGSATLERKNKIDNALAMLSEVKTGKGKSKEVIEKDMGAQVPTGTRAKPEDFEITSQTPAQTDCTQLLDTVVSIGKERKELQDRLIFIYREISRMQAWGNFDPASIKELSKHLPVFLYELTADVFAAIPEDVRFIMVSKGKSAVQILVLDAELPSGLMPGLAPFQLPEKSIPAFYREIDEINIKINDVNEKLRSLSLCNGILLKEKAIVEQRIEYENALSKMETVTGISSQQTLSYIIGYVPTEDMEGLKKVAGKNCWALSSDDPEETDENVPTKLKNNKLVSLLNPLTDFLGIVPGYREEDISPWFLLFFCIFFGMIFGDAVYGIILLLISIIGITKTSKKEVPQGLQLLLLLGAFTTVWGVMTCTWLGVEVEKVPGILRDISLSAFSTAKTSKAGVDQNMQFFCFSLGLIHLTIARVKSIFKKIKSPGVFGEIGNLAMVWGMFNVVLFLVVSNDELRVYPLLPVSIYLLGGGFALNFIFGAYERSVGQSVLDGAKNFITVVLGLPNIFSDIMSYIRLWAVALAGASIASTVNLMAGPMLGNFLVFAGILLLASGHGLNLVLNVLSVLVHGVRLNTLEFSGHVGLSWSGVAYRPFAEKIIK